MPLILSGNVASATAAVGYDVANSCRFNYADSAYLTRTFGSAGNRRTWTFSTWCKRSKFGAQQTLFGTSSGSGTYHLFYWGSDESLSHNFSGANVSTSYYRDIGAWYHVVCAVDTTQGTAANRVKLYVNGVQLGTGTYPDEDAEMILNDAVRCDVGSSGAHYTSHMCGHYLAETVFIDGTQYAASDFGEFDSDSPTIWKPKDVSELTFGTNGFYFDYEDSGTLGNDANGGTDWTATNLAATDQSTDTPTNNFATWNSLFRKGTTTPAFAEANLTATFDDGGANEFALTTFGVNTGKWYAEVKWTSNTGTAATATGILDMAYTGTDDPNNAVTNAFGYFGSGTKNVSGTASSYGDSYTDGDIISLLINCDDNELIFQKNGTSQASGAAIDIVAGVTYGIFATDYNSKVAELNTGSPSTAFSISSGNADANGYGNFEYAVPSGYFALCTKNLAEHGG